ncbi:MAG: type IV secretory system conjugative DNA transfer family protein, partial [Alphaproteobacteria bacterium]|nr:type IV secretory system conjugative DNA transfer family protein [Alphaproteobacteria bacterium]
MAKERGEEWAEYDKAVRWMSITFFICLVISILLFIFSMPISHLVKHGISQSSMATIRKFMSLIMSNPAELFSFYGRWFKIITHYSGPFALSLWIPVLPFLVIPVGLIVSAIFSPYKFQVNIHGSAKVAELRDIKKMALLGFDGFCQVVGKFDGKFLMLKETLATLCCAPPGTGKTAGVVIPTIFHSQKLSIIVNDPKPELCYSTTGARAKVGPVFVINWGAEDNPSEGLYYPSWNPLSPNCLPEQGPERDM